MSNSNAPQRIFSAFEPDYRSIGSSTIFGARLGTTQYELLRTNYLVPRYEEMKGDKGEFQQLETDLNWREGIAGLVSIVSLAICSGFFFWLYQSFIVRISSY